jgi:hydantoinase/carbamoylase family amidase
MLGDFIPSLDRTKGILSTRYLMNAASARSSVLFPAIDGMKRFTCCHVSRLWLTPSTNPSRQRVRNPRLLKRDFATTPGLRLRTSELRVSQLKDLKANADRLWNDIHDTAQWGIGKRYGDSRESTGMSRLTLSDADKTVREWFVETTKSLSCNTHVDQMGNIFAVRPGLDNSKPATFVGSHLDTQPTGGRFDGILGVCAGIEMLRVLEENWIETEGPVGIVNWTNEEGARFPLSMMGSGVWCGQIPLDKAHSTLEVGDPQGSRKSVKEELDRIGYLGETECNWKSGIQMGGHFELHIEQGPHLVSANQKIGVVEGAQAYQWFTIIIEGRDCHSGTTSLNHRVDALYNAAQLTVAVRKIARRLGGLATVGIIKAEPGSVNTVPGLVTMSLDMRHHRDDQLYRMIDKLHPNQ